MLVDVLPVDDKALLVLIADGEENAFKKLVHKYGALIYPYLVKFTRSSAIAEDLSQEIFLKVWIHRDKLPAIEDVNAWIFRIAANTARSWLKKKLREQQILQHYNNGPASCSSQDLLDFRETQKLLLEAIQSLPREGGKCTSCKGSRESQSPPLPKNSMSPSARSKIPF